MASTTEGVRKINEMITQDGRSLIMTDLSIQPENVPAGTIQVDPATGNLRVKTTTDTWINLTPANLFTEKAITSNYLADRTLTGTQIALDTIENGNIKDLTIGTSKFIDGAITEGKLAASSVTTTKIKDAAITTSKIANEAIVEASIATGAVTIAKLADNAIISSKIANDAVTSTKIAANSIVTAKIMDGNVTTTKLADAAVNTFKLADTSVTTAKMANASVTAEKMADNAVTTLKLVDLNVTSTKLANFAVVESKIGDGAVTNTKIGNASITNSKLADGSVSSTKLDTAMQNAINQSIKMDAATSTANVGGHLKATGNITATGDITGARVLNSVYMDLAEAYLPGESNLIAGDIVQVDELGRVIKAKAYTRAAVGVVSDGYAALYGATAKEIETGEKIAVGLIGKVPVNIAGPANVGDFVVSCGNGIGAAVTVAKPGTIIGKVIQSKHSHGIGKTLCLIYPA